MPLYSLKSQQQQQQQRSSLYVRFVYAIIFTTLVSVLLCQHEKKQLSTFYVVAIHSIVPSKIFHKKYATATTRIINNRDNTSIQQLFLKNYLHCSLKSLQWNSNHRIPECKEVDYINRNNKNNNKRLFLSVRGGFAKFSNTDDDDDETSDSENESSDDENEDEDDEEENDGKNKISVKDTISKAMSTTTTTTTSNNGEIEYDEPLVPSPFLNMLISFGVMLVARKYDLFQPLFVKGARFAYIAYLIILQFFVLYVRIRAKIRNDRTPIEMTNPLSNLLQKQLGGDDSSSSSNSGGGANGMLKNLASSFLQSKSTIVEYDIKQATSMQSGLIFNTLFMYFLHFKMKQVQPLLIQTLNGYVSLLYSPLFQVYVLGRNLERPFKVGPTPSGTEEEGEEDGENTTTESDVVKEEEDSSTTSIKEVNQENDTSTSESDSESDDET